jgi:hypothetical protein
MEEVPSVSSGVPSLAGDRFGKDWITFVEAKDHLKVEVWKINKEFTYAEIFDVDKNQLTDLVISREEIDRIPEDCIKDGTNSGWMIFLYAPRKGRFKVRWVRRLSDGQLEVDDHNLSDKRAFFSPRGYLLIVPKLA